MPIEVAADLVRWLVANHGQVVIRVEGVTDADLRQRALAAAVRGIAAIRHPDEPDEQFASIVHRGRDGESVEADMADANAEVLAATVDAVVAAIGAVGIADAFVTAPGLNAAALDRLSPPPVRARSTPADPKRAALAALRCRLDEGRLLVTWITQVPWTTGSSPAAPVGFSCTLLGEEVGRWLHVTEEGGELATRLELSGPAAPAWQDLPNDDVVEAHVDTDGVHASVASSEIVWRAEPLLVSGKSWAATGDGTETVTTLEEAFWLPEHDNEVRLVPGTGTRRPEDALPPELSLPSPPPTVEFTRDRDGGRIQTWLNVPAAAIERHFIATLTAPTFHTVTRAPYEELDDQGLPTWTGTTWTASGPSLRALINVASPGNAEGRRPGAMVTIHWMPEAPE